MITEEVGQAADRLGVWWDAQTNGLSYLQLDYTWPSVGILDVITHFLRYGQQGGSERDAFVRSVACYLGCFAYNAWAFLGKEVGEEPELLDMPDGVVLRLGSASSPTGQMHLLVNITQSLNLILRQDITEVPVFANFKRQALYPQSNLLSLFGIGLILGFAPHCSGPLANRNQIQAREQNEQIVRMLASSCSDYYRTVFPDEQVGQVAEFYLNDLIYPPLEMNEKFHAKRAVEGILKFANYCSLTDEQLSRLALNLTLSPDELISVAGFVVYVALLNGEPDPRVVTIASGRHPFNLMLRHAVVHVRRTRLHESDWLYAEREMTERDMACYKLETSLSLLPKFNLPLEYICDSAVLKVIRHFVEMDFYGGVKAFNHLVGQHQDNVTMRLQRGALALLSQNKEKAQEDFEFFSRLARSGNKGEPTLDFLAQSYFLADYHSSNANYEEALHCLRRAQVLASERGESESLDLSGRMGALMMYLERYSEAFELFQKVDPEGKTLSSALGQLLAGRKIGKTYSSEEALLKFKALWPMNQSVLAALYMRA